MVTAKIGSVENRTFYFLQRRAGDERGGRRAGGPAAGKSQVRGRGLEVGDFLDRPANGKRKRYPFTFYQFTSAAQSRGHG